MISTTTRNATLGDLAILLKDQHARKLDVVAPASTIRAENGLLVVEGADAILTEDGVTRTEGRYRPTSICDEGVATKLGIPLPYLRRLRDERVDLYDANVNGWLEDDRRSFLLRCFRGDGAEEGLARAFLSDRYGIVDNLDVLTAALAGVQSAGVEVSIDGCDLTDRRMYVRVTSPAVRALAPDLLRGYRSPFSGASGTENPVVFAGFVISNSETGGGAFTLTPRIVFQVCSNGMTISKDALRAIHLGTRMEEGVIRWSTDTQQRAIELVTAKTRDAVATFLDVDYVRRTISELTEQAGVEVHKADAVVRDVGKRLAYDEATIDGVLDHFIRGGQLTAGGVFQAVTSYAQTVADADLAADLEDSAARALETAAALASA